MEAQVSYQDQSFNGISTDHDPSSRTLVIVTGSAPAWRQQVQHLQFGHSMVVVRWSTRGSCLTVIDRTLAKFSRPADAKYDAPIWRLLWLPFTA
jgi:hypothetical protein